MGVAFLTINAFGKMIAVFGLILAMIATSCASYTKVHPEPINIKSVIEPGDTVKIVTKDNKEIKFVVVEVSDEAIIGDNEKVFFNDISTLEELSVGAGKNALIIIGITTGAAAGAMMGGAGGIGTPDLR